MSGWPVRFGDAPPAVGPAPLLGEHSGDVLGDWLGIEAGTIAELRAAKVIAEPTTGPAKAIA
jgi:crotonobetainyl-CoA:carnitine CoA-transferase CaiB-like acyl-CoA transferase